MYNLRICIYNEHIFGNKILAMQRKTYGRESCKKVSKFSSIEGGYSGEKFIQQLWWNKEFQSNLKNEATIGSFYNTFLSLMIKILVKLKAIFVLKITRMSPLRVLAVAAC